MAKAKKSKKDGSKKRNKKATRSVVPKSLRKGALPTSVTDVMTAGLGALREAQSNGGTQFDALVTRGRAVQTSGSDAAREAVRDVEGAVDRVMETVRSARGTVVGGVQDRAEAVVEGVLARLGLPTRDEIRELQATVDALTARVTTTDASSTGEARSVFEVRHQDDGWAVRRAGAERATSVRSTKKEALHGARVLARHHTPSTLTVYKLDGTVSDTTDYGE